MNVKINIIELKYNIIIINEYKIILYLKDYSLYNLIYC